MYRFDVSILLLKCLCLALMFKIFCSRNNDQIFLSQWFSSTANITAIDEYFKNIIHLHELQTKLHHILFQFNFLNYFFDLECTCLKLSKINGSFQNFQHPIKEYFKWLCCIFFKTHISWLHSWFACVESAFNQEF